MTPPTMFSSQGEVDAGHGVAAAGAITPRRVAITVAVALALHSVALLRKAALNSDEATIATVARMMRHGAGLYTDAVDRKPPGAFVLYRLLEPLFGSWTLVAGRWVVLAALIAAAWLLAAEASRRWPRVSVLAVAVVGVIAFSVFPAEDSRAVGFELLGTLPAVGAFVLGSRRRFVLAGIALGVAGLFKQPFLLGAIPLAVQCVTSLPAWAARARALAAAAAATALTIVAGLAPFGLHDAWSWYSGVGDKYLSGTEVTTVAIVALEQFGIVAAVVMGLLILAALAWWRKRIPADVLAWTVAGVVASSLGLRFILHYFNQLLPALVLAAAPALTGRGAFRRPLPRLAAAWLAGAAAVSAFTMVAPTAVHDLPDVDAVAAAVRERTGPGDRIFVWGQAPEIYWLSGRDPATRYPHIGFIAGVTPKRPGVAAYTLAQPDAADHLLDDLRAHPPAVIVDAAIASVRGGDRYPLATSPIAAYVDDGYCETAVIDGMRLLEPCLPES